MVKTTCGHPEEAEDRAKLPSETFHQLFFSKLKLLLAARKEHEEDVMNCASHTFATSGSLD